MNLISKILRLRRPNKSDVEQIQEIASKFEFPLPERFIEAAVVENSEKIIAFGVIRSNMEAILYCSGTVREKSEALKELMKKAIEDTLSHNYYYLDVLAQNQEFADILIKHFGFKRVEGVPLILDLREYNEQQTKQSKSKSA